jgi:hypothetical protein
MSLDGAKLANQAKLLVIIGMMILLTQRVGYGIGIVQAIPGIILVILISLFALVVRGLLPSVKMPAFAWASLTALILSMPFMPTAEVFLRYTNEVNFLGTTAPILAFAGISVGDKISKLKSLSWKVLIVAIAVFIGTFYGSAIISHIVLSIQGII